MKIDFNRIAEGIIPNFKGGKGMYIMKHYSDGQVKVMMGKLRPGHSIGLHRHEGNSEVVYVLSGVATCLYEGEEFTLLPGEVHYCPMGKEHSLINNGTEDLTFFAVVPEHCLAMEEK